MGKRRAKLSALLSRMASLMITAALISGVGFVAATADEFNPQSPAEAIVAGLSARLENVTLEEGKPIELDFVLKNHSNADIVLAERWNSWGAYQWELTVVDANGARFVLGNPQRAWFRNFLTTFSIQPSKSYVTKCRLDPTSHAFEDGGVAIFSQAEGILEEPKSWVFPLSITGTFSARKEAVGAAGKKGPNWSGTITTNTVQDDEAKDVTVTLTDGKLPCGVGRVQKDAVWNEPYRYVFRAFPDYLAGAQHIFMRQNGGGSRGPVAGEGPGEGFGSMLAVCGGA